MRSSYVYRDLARLVLAELDAPDLPHAWSRIVELVRASREYVLLKFMAQLHALLDDEVYERLGDVERDFLARDLVVMLYKVRQLKQMLTGRDPSNHVLSTDGPSNTNSGTLGVAEPR